MKKEVTFKTFSWKHQIMMLALTLLVSGGLFAQNHSCNAFFQYQQGNSTNAINFYPATNPANTHYSWTFGDGGTSAMANPNHTYASAGTYYVCLTVIDTNFMGVCNDTHCDSIHVNPPPPPPTCNAHFTWQQGTVANSVNFASSQNANGSHYAWDFGDGHTSTNGFTNHTYASSGTFYVCLTVTDSTFSGSCTDTYCDSVHASGPPPPVCNAHFTWQPDFHGNICFNSAQNSFGYHYSWTFGDGGTSSQDDPCHMFASAGTYYVCLTVVDTNSSGTCSDTQCDSITVGNPPPPTCNAHFNHFYFNGGVSFVPYQNSGGTTTYSWTFGDGATSSLRHPSHTYASAGTYYVCLTVADSNSAGSCTDTDCDSIHVGHNPPPPPPHHFGCNAHFRYFTISGNDTVVFHNAPNSHTTTYAWDFGDGTTSTQANPTHVYPDTLVYYACLTVNDSDSTGVKCTATFCDSIHVGSHQHCLNSWHPRVAGPADLVTPTAVLYPNPMTETSTIHIENTSGNVTFRVFELNGRLAVSKQLGNGDYQLDKNNLGTGMYFYDVVDGNDSVIKGKLIIQ